MQFVDDESVTGSDANVRFRPKAVTSRVRNMGIFHYKAVLKERTADGLYLYAFYPDFVMAKDVSGVFSVLPGEWQPAIIVAAEAEAKGLVSSDGRFVLALTAKLKRQFEADGQMPDEILRIS